MHELLAQAIIDDRHRTARAARRTRALRRGRVRRTYIRDLLAVLRRKRGYIVVGGRPDRRDGPGTVRHMARLICSMLMSLDGYTEDEQGRFG